MHAASAALQVTPRPLASQGGCLPSVTHLGVSLALGGRVISSCHLRGRLAHETLRCQLLGAASFLGGGALHSCLATREGTPCCPMRTGAGPLLSGKVGVTFLWHLAGADWYYLKVLCLPSGLASDVTSGCNFFSPQWGTHGQRGWEPTTVRHPRGPEVPPERCDSDP